MDHRSLYGEKGFLFKNGTYERFEPIGITWNDTYCRRITEEGPSGCFVERDLSASPDFDYQENNCTGTDSMNLLGVKAVSQAYFSANFDRKILEYIEFQKRSILMLWFRMETVR